jgi:hypothetical protein
MNRQKLTLIALLVVGLAAVVNAAQFKMALDLDGKDTSRVFGLKAEADMTDSDFLPVVPSLGVVIQKYIYFEGPGTREVVKATPYSGATERPFTDMSMLSVYMKPEAKAALWKVYLTGDNGKITFRLISGSLPAGSVLKVYPEGNESEAIDITEATVLEAQADVAYLIDYRETATTQTALACPPLKYFQMSNGKKVLPLAFDVPDGLSLESDSTVYPFSFNAENYEYVALGEGLGSFNAANTTLTMTNLDNVSRIQFNYWFTDGTRTSEKAVVIVDVIDGIKTSLVKKEDVATGKTYSGSFIGVDPDDADYAGTVLTYKIDFDAATIGKNVTLKVIVRKLPPNNVPFGIQYCFVNDADAAADYTELPFGGSVDYPVTSDSIYFKVKATLTSKCENGPVTPALTTPDGEAFEMESVSLYLLSGGTMDIDGNGVITEDDAIMMYNFIALGGIDDPESMFVEDIIQGIDETQVDAEAALATLKSLAAFLDYDENGDITEDDAIMMYNFIALGGIDDPDSMFVEDIIQGIDETQVDAEKALENFKKYASK